MVYDLPHFRIDRNDWLKGSNTFDNYPDGGFQYSSSGYNAFTKPGLIGTVQDIGSTVTGSLQTGVGISFGLGKGVITQQAMCVGNNSSQDGYFYTVTDSTGALTLVGSADTGRDYVLGKTSTVYYHGKFYTTSTTDMVQQNYDLTGRTVSWWIGTKGQAALDSNSPHPQVVYGDIRYIADGQYIHQDDNGTIQTQVFDLGNDWVITEMEVYNNLIYIAAEPYYNFGATYHGLAKIFTWNGYADSWIDEYFVDSRISAMYVYKNILYVFMPEYLGYFDGSVVKNLYPVGQQIYKSQITSTSNSMWFADGTKVVRYGSPYLTGKFKFHRYYTTGQNINGLCSPHVKSLLICTTGSSNGSNFYVPDVNAAGSGSNTFDLNTRIFARPVKIRGYVINTTNMNNGYYAEMSYVDDTGDIKAVKRFGWFANALMQNKSRWRFSVTSELATMKCAPRLTIANGLYVKSVDVLYEPVEDPGNA